MAHHTSDTNELNCKRYTNEKKNKGIIRRYEACTERFFFSIRLNPFDMRCDALNVLVFVVHIRLGPMTDAYLTIITI